MGASKVDIWYEVFPTGFSNAGAEPGRGKRSESRIRLMQQSPLVKPEAMLVVNLKEVHSRNKTGSGCNSRHYSILGQHEENLRNEGRKVPSRGVTVAGQVTLPRESPHRWSTVPRQCPSTFRRPWWLKGSNQGLQSS